MLPAVERSVRSGILLLGLVAVVFATFSPALEGTFVWDDHPLLAQNAALASGDFGQALERHYWDVFGAETSHARYYRPLVTLSFMVDRRLHGLDPSGFHLTNLLLHLLATVAAFYYLRGVLGELLPAFAATLIWALHPSRAEAVAWISGRCDVLAGLLVLCSLIAFARAFELGGAKRVGMLGLGWASAIGAVLAKETGVVVALLVPARELWVGGRARLRKHLAALLPLAVAATAYSIGRLSSFDPVELRLDRRAWLFIQTLAEYAHAIVFPFRPTALRGEASELVRPDLLMVGTGVVVLCVVVLAALRGDPRVRYGIGFFVIALLPTLNLRPLRIPHMVAERFLYLPLLGLALAAGVWVARVSRKAVAVGVVVVLAGAFAAASYRRSADFKDEVEFWRREATLHPRSSLAREHLGDALVARRRHTEAERAFLSAFRIAADRGRPDAALENLYRALEARLMHVGDDDPLLVQARTTLERLLGARDNRVSVLCVGRDCLQIAPAQLPAVQSWIASQRAKLHASLGAIDSRLGDDSAALKHLDAAVAADPRLAVALLSRALARLRARDLDGAERDLSAIRKRLPAREARALEETMRLAGPILRALAKEPGSTVQEQRLLAQLFIVTKAPRRAERALREVVRLAPSDLEARALLAYEVAVLGRVAEATALIEAARRELGDSHLLRAVEAQLKRLTDPR